MKIALISLAATALTLGLSQASSAEDYGYRDETRQALRHDYREYNEYAHREREAVREGDYREAEAYQQRRKAEEREIAARRRELSRDNSYN